MDIIGRDLRIPFVVEEPEQLLYHNSEGAVEVHIITRNELVSSKEFCVQLS